MFWSTRNREFQADIFWKLCWKFFSVSHMSRWIFLSKSLCGLYFRHDFSNAIAFDLIFGNKAQFQKCMSILRMYESSYSQTIDLEFEWSLTCWTTTWSIFHHRRWFWKKCWRRGWPKSWQSIKCKTKKACFDLLERIKKGTKSFESSYHRRRIMELREL